VQVDRPEIVKQLLDLASGDRMRWLVERVRDRVCCEGVHTVGDLRDVLMTSRPSRSATYHRWMPALGQDRHGHPWLPALPLIAAGPRPSRDVAAPD
jgi:hypothetical protein